MAMKKASAKTVTLGDIEKFGKGRESRPIESAIFQKKVDAKLEKLEKSIDKRFDKDIKKSSKRITQKLEKATI